jgi:3-keto-disaccharide hydrolase
VTRKIALAISLLGALALPAAGQQPPVVDPGTAGQPPSDAIVLFDGKDLSAWMHQDGRPASWPVIDGVITCKTGTGDIYSRRKLASAQIQVEFSIPYMPDAHDQARGNSGVYLQGRYEIQVLDSYQNPTYPDGSCAALYGQYAPLVNASRPPEQWQSYDIIFRAPKCSEDGQVTAPATLTLLHNGILVQDHVTVQGPTPGSDDANVCQPGPLRLQDHSHPDVTETFMRFRNIWYRPIEDLN